MKQNIVSVTCMFYYQPDEQIGTIRKVIQNSQYSNNSVYIYKLHQFLLVIVTMKIMMLYYRYFPTLIKLKFRNEDMAYQIY